MAETTLLACHRRCKKWAIVNWQDRLHLTVAQQQFENQKIVRQEILAERSQITSGTNPPNVKLNLPEQVNVRAGI